MEPWWKEFQENKEKIKIKTNKQKPASEKALKQPKLDIYENRNEAQGAPCGELRKWGTAGDKQGPDYGRSAVTIHSNFSFKLRESHGPF